MNSQKLVTIGASIVSLSIIALDASMLLLDEQFTIFPYVYGFDIRYLLSLGITLFTVGAVLVVKGFRKVFKK